MKQLHSNSDDRDIFDFIRDAVENGGCDAISAGIAINALAAWKTRPDPDDEDADDKERIKELES